VTLKGVANVSYILEAIKKLEEKRQQEGTPNILTLQAGGIAQVPKKRLLWPYAVAGIILLNGAALSLLWTTSWRQAGRPPSVRTPPVRESVSAPYPAVSAENKERQRAAVKKEVPFSTQKKAGQPDGGLPAVPLNAKAASRSPAVVFPPAPSTMSGNARAEMPPRINKPVAPGGRVNNIQGLPAELKSSLPDLKMTVHSYDERSDSRFVIINNKNMKEGQFVAPELKLERITPDGAVLGYQGHRFFLGIN